MKNDLRDSAIATCEEKGRTLGLVRSDLTKLTNYEKAIETQIIDIFDIYAIYPKELSVIDIINEPKPTKIPLKTILDVFPSDDVKLIVENIVANIEIDLKATEENLRFSANFQEPIIKSIIKQLKKLTNETVKKVVVK